MRRELALSLVLAACGTTPVPAPAGCSEGLHADAARQARLEARLGSVAEGSALLAAARDRVAAVCFAAPGSASVVTTDRVLVLAEDLEESEAAARLGHLLVHLRDGLPLEAVPEGARGAACDEAVTRALALESVAYATEIELQRALEATPHVLRFEITDAVLALAPEARARYVARYLAEHPDGAPGIEGLAHAYRLRCAP
ncbi:MAG: hypothetical protein U0234_17675 [Sandaracinus sp.]